MAKLSLSQMRTLKKHSEHHSKKHMDMMKKLMREGKSFKAAHTASTETSRQIMSLKRWFKEKWVDVKTGKPCGRQK